MGVGRREGELWGLLNVCVSFSAQAVTTLSDPRGAGPSPDVRDSVGSRAAQGARRPWDPALALSHLQDLETAPQLPGPQGREPL